MIFSVYFSFSLDYSLSDGLWLLLLQGRTGPVFLFSHMNLHSFKKQGSRSPHEEACTQLKEIECFPVFAF